LRNVIKIIAIAGIFTAAGCEQQKNWLMQIEKGDLSFVECGKGIYSQRQIHLDKEDSLIFASAESLAVTKGDYLIKCLESCSKDSLPKSVRMRFTGILGDDQGRIFLTYLAAYPRPKIMAGKRLQIVLDARRNLEKVLVYDMPLEAQ